MRILFLAQVLPFPLNAGPKVRAYYVLKYLAEQGHDVTLLSFAREDDLHEHVEPLGAFCEAVHVIPMRRSWVGDAAFLARSFARDESFIIARDRSEQMRKKIDDLMGQVDYDVIHADQLWMAQYALKAKGAKRVLDQHNAVYLIPQRLAVGACNPIKRALLQREARLLARYEAETCPRFERVVTVTEPDKNLLVDLCRNGVEGGPDTDPESRFSVIPICVDPKDKPVIERRSDARRLLILGTMFWPPNVEGTLWFGAEVLPLILEQVPDVLLTVIGKDPPHSVRRLAERYPANLDVTGYVPDPTPYLQESAAFLVPLQAGGGMRVKILDGWCWGLPILSTSIGAEGIDIRSGENILIADDPAAFAAAVISVLQRPDLGQRLGNKGRGWVESNYDWRRVYSAWDRVYEGLDG